MDKTFWLESLKQFGIGIVFAAMLMFYYSHENKKWEINQDNDQRRWEQLFQKYSDDQRTALETIRACCSEQHWRNQ